MTKLSYSSATFSLVGVHLGGGMMIATCQEAYKNGLYGAFYSLGIVIGLIVLGFIYKKKNQNTISETFKNEYGSNFLHKASSILSSVSFSIILAAQFSALRSVLSGFHSSIFILISIFVILYSIIGGIEFVVNVNKIQVGIVVFTCLVMLLLIKVNVSKAKVLDCLLSVKTVPSVFNIIMPMLFCFIEQDVMQKFFMSKDLQTARRAGFSAGIILFLISLFPVYIGVLAKAVGFKYSDSILFDFISINIKFGWLVLIVIIMAMLSTVDSIICAVNSNITHDFKVKNDKFIMIFIALISFMFSYSKVDILTFFISAYKLIVYTMFCAIFFVNNNKEYGYYCFSIGLIGFFISHFSSDYILFLCLFLQFVGRFYFKKKNPSNLGHCNSYKKVFTNRSRNKDESQIGYKIDSLDELKGKENIWLEIGFGTGGHFYEQVLLNQNKDIFFIGCDPFTEGCIALSKKLKRSSISDDSVKIYEGPVGDLFDHLKKGSLDRVFILFPDPWPKAKHKKRRIMSPDFINKLLEFMSEKGMLRFATDHSDYIESVYALLLYSKKWIVSDINEYPDNWPRTKFQTKAENKCLAIEARKL